MSLLQNLSKDILFCLAKEMDYSTIINFCFACRNNYNLLYQRDDIWNYMLIRDFGNFTDIHTLNFTDIHTLNFTKQDNLLSYLRNFNFDFYESTREKYKTLYLLTKLKNYIRYPGDIESLYQLKAYNLKENKFYKLNDRKTKILGNDFCERRILETLIKLKIVYLFDNEYSLESCFGIREKFIAFMRDDQYQK